MRRFVAVALTAVVVYGILDAVNGLLTAAVADDLRTFQPEEALTTALSNGDKTAVSGLLDEKFQWVDVDGQARTKMQSLEDLTAFRSAETAKGTGVLRRDYGQTEVVLGLHETARFGHVWVKRPAGWRAFIYMDTPIRGQSAEFTPRAPGAADKACDNPCKKVPYKPESAAQQEVLTTWMRIKTDEWQANAEDWDALTDVDHVTINSSSVLPKAPHVTELLQQKGAYGGAGAGVPVISMNLTDFGNVVVMTSLEGRDSAKPSAWALRMFINRGAGWKICLSIHTDVVGRG